VSRLAIDGVQYNFEEAGGGPPLLLLHGFTGSGATWEVNLPAFQPYFRVITLDLPGHGASDAPPDPRCYSIEQTAAATVAILDSLKIAKAAVLGYSMGGRIALYFAVHYPEQVERLILESASPGLLTGQERADRVASDEALAGFIEQKGLTAFVDRWEKLPLFASQANLPVEVRAKLRRQRLQNQPTGLANSLRGVGTGQQPSLWENLAGLTCPVLLLAGELDPKFKATGQQMQARLPAARLEIVAGAGHTIHLEKPREFENLVKGFLNGDV
jgi:2-succinyl-6-hydroxy-2,4-cyclohexadiene-1-carboxylate synthase